MQTHCKRGHEFTDENVLPQSPTANGKRMCRACQRERDRAYQARRYHSTDPETHRKVSAKQLRGILRQRAKRSESRSPRPAIDLAFIDRIVLEETSGAL